MSARTSKVARIKAPVKKQIRQLGGNLQNEFHNLLNEIVSRLSKDGYKLSHVTKSYRKKETIVSDNFWKKEKVIGNIKIIWICTVRTVFKNGFEFRFDFDYWFDFSRLLQNLKADIHEKGFPKTSRPYAKGFWKKEADQALEKVEKSIKKMVKRQIGGWGRHGIINEVTNRKSSDICHRIKISISSISEIEKLRNSLRKLGEDPTEMMDDFQIEIEKTSREKLNQLFPFSLNAQKLEGHLAFFLWFRKPGGGFEYQLHRFAHENFKRILKPKEIEKALLKLEVHGYAKVKETPNELRRKLEKRGIKRCRRFYETGEKRIPGRKLFKELKNEVNIGAYLAPVSRKILMERIDAPKHLVDKSINGLVRRNYLSKRRIRDSLGRSVRKIKPNKNPLKTSGLKRQIMEKASGFYDIQKKALDQLQAGRP